MSTKFVGTPPKIGLEIEANWPAYRNLPEELRAALERPHADGQYEYEVFRNVSGDVVTHRRRAHVYYDRAPEKFHYPSGWDKTHDSGVEMRFNGPASTLAEAEELVESGTTWLKNMNFTQFVGAGTHVHLGHVAWLDERFGRLTESNLLRSRAEQMMWAYFATRERGIFSVAPAQRYSNHFCFPFFAVPTNILRTTEKYTGHVGGNFSETTPIWAVHNFFASRPIPLYGTSNLGIYDTEGLPLRYVHAGLTGASTCNRRKNLPTIEFRHFEGTGQKSALLGYIRLLYNMFRRATHVMTEENLKAMNEDSAFDPIVANPATYTIADLKAEVGDDSWLQTWIDKTIENNGQPITQEISIASTAPVAVAAT